jgi:hypothetical protein
MPRSRLGCHRKDDDSAKGHKGRFGEKCDSCHDTEAWKPSTFNHDIDTKYALRGKHRTTRCAACHTGHLFRDKVGTGCIDCHRKDDTHKGSLGRDCGACHTERDWKESPKFDHDKTRFPLLGKHRDTTCKDCHKGANYKEAPSDCLGCHRKDDKHAGDLGPKCADCHNERAWKPAPKFEHDKTRFQLRNAHAAPKVKCSACHADQTKYRDTRLECVACHKKDDKHDGTQGEKCDQCHGDKDWRTTRFDHRLTRFPLLGRHAAVKCDACTAAAAEYRQGSEQQFAAAQPGVGGIHLRAPASSSRARSRRTNTGRPAGVGVRPGSPRRQPPAPPARERSPPSTRATGR